MKLKDILKTDTDNKGWLRVFKKLGADAEMLKYVNENISKSGGGGEGVKEYYYKVVGGEEIIGQIGPTLNMLNLKSVVVSTYKNETVLVEAYMDRDGSMYIPGHFIHKLNDAFAISEKGTYIFQELNDDYRIVIMPKGDLRTKLMFLGQPEELVNEVMSCFQEITKEEYESLITQ